MEKASLARIAIPNAAVVAVMVSFAIFAGNMAHIDGTGLFLDYLLPAASVGIVALLFWVAQTLVVLALKKEARPFGEIQRRFVRLAPVMLIPILIQPAFFAAFTLAKTSIAPLASFTWDRAFAMMDAAIFGVDPWRLTHALIGPLMTRFLEIFYTGVWGLTLVFAQAFVAIYASRAFMGRFFLALNLTWLTGGIILAFALPAAGPIFADLFDPSLAGRFSGLHQMLDSILAPDGPILRTQDYLLGSLGRAVAERGGGISAMPSIHVATAILFLLAARGTRWFWPTMIFTVLTFIGSVHFGYHYAVDGCAALPLVWLCWQAAGLCFRRVAPENPPVSDLVWER